MLDNPVRSDSDKLCSIIVDSVYTLCKKSCKPENDQIEIDMSCYPNCNSCNFKAMAEVNLSTYEIFTYRGMPLDERIAFLEDWIKFEKMAVQAENKELNIRKKQNMEEREKRFEKDVVND